MRSQKIQKKEKVTIFPCLLESLDRKVVLFGYDYEACEILCVVLNSKDPSTIVGDFVRVPKEDVRKYQGKIVLENDEEDYEECGDD